MKKQKKKLIIFYTSIFFQHFAFGIIVPILIVWQYKNGLSFNNIALIQGVGLFVILLTEIPSSYLADKVGKKITMVAGLLAIACSFAVLIGAGEFEYFLLFQILFSAGLAFLSGTEEAFLHDITLQDPKKITKYLGQMSIADEFGTIIGMFVSSLTIIIANIEISFIFSLIGVIIALCLLLSITSRQEIIQKGGVSLTDFSFIKIVSFKHISGYTLLVIVAFALLSERGEMLYQGQLEALGLHLEVFGFVYILGKLCAILGSYFSNYFYERFTSNYLFLIIGILQIVAFLFLLLPYKVIVVSSLCAYFFLENIFRNVRSSFVLQMSPDNQRATNLSLISFSTSIILIGTKLGLGWTMDKLFIYAILFIVSLKLIAMLCLIKSNNVLIQKQ